MKLQKIRIALAVNHIGVFEACHFGDADKFLIYEWDNQHFFLVKEEPNIHKNTDEEEVHGSQKKGNAIVNFLQQLEVKVLVSKQFGKNMKMINQHFIPVIVHSDHPEEVVSTLNKHNAHLLDELTNSIGSFSHFNLKDGRFVKHISV